MNTLEDHLLLLSSDKPSERAIAGLVLNRSGIVLHRDAVRRMVLQERDPLVVMSLAPSIVGWQDETIDALLAADLEESAVYALLVALRLQKRTIRQERMRVLLNHASPLVRLAALEGSYAIGLVNDFLGQIDQLRIDAKKTPFLVKPNQPSPIFSNRTKFLRRLSRLRAVVSKEGSILSDV